MNSIVTVIALAVFAAGLAVAAPPPLPFSADLAPGYPPPGYPPPPPPPPRFHGRKLLLQNNLSNHGWSCMEFICFSVVAYCMGYDLFLKYLPGLGRKLWFGLGCSLFGPRPKGFATKVWTRMKNVTEKWGTVEGRIA